MIQSWYFIPLAFFTHMVLYCFGYYKGSKFMKGVMDRGMSDLTDHAKLRIKEMAEFSRGLR